jgi:hypothetical protein
VAFSNVRGGQENRPYGLKVFTSFQANYYKISLFLKKSINILIKYMKVNVFEELEKNNLHFFISVLTFVQKMCYIIYVF